ncbi:hypothetical protein CVT24_011641 [Panaeolus cyanescens]|uniref:Ribonucleases P/MRP subunit Pop8-like domain-containing protein n=1 Tax=Panaeolus cyanescens TaxID=181874 RepID=A0A409YH05_9AGAR|nr:hypothetical protein CVT24_011641 [Panaeolus cyanescens]
MYTRWGGFCSIILLGPICICHINRGCVLIKVLIRSRIIVVEDVKEQCAPAICLHPACILSIISLQQGHHTAWLRTEQMSQKHYIRFSVNPPTKDALTIRKALANAISDSHGITAAGTFLDILYVSDEGKDCVIRLNRNDTSMVVSAMASAVEEPRLSVVKESPFLPSLLEH